MSQITTIISGSGPGAVVQTLTGNSGGAVGPTAGNINVLGTGVITVVGNPGTSTLTITPSGSIASSFITNPATGTATPVAGVLTFAGAGGVVVSAAGSTVTITGAASTAVLSLTTDDTNVVTPAAGTINLAGAHGLNTTGTVGPNTATVAINNTITLGDLSVVPVNTPALTITTGDISMVAGNITFPFSNAAGTEGFIYVAGVPFMSSLGTGNTFLGQSAGGLGSSGSLFNTGMGSGSLASLIATADNNSAFGAGSLGNLAGSGDLNIAIGNNAASTYTTTESSNIIIGNTGVIGDNNTIRIGASGGASGQQNLCFIGGIDGVSVGSTAKVVTMGTAGTADQLGTAVITAGTGISVSSGANTITISTTGTTTLTVTTVNNAASPYTVLSTDEFLAVNTSGGAVTIRLPNAPATGRVYYIKDSNGTAAASNITVTTVGGAVNIDGATSFVMNTAYESISVIFDGSAYEVF